MLTTHGSVLQSLGIVKAVLAENADKRTDVVNTGARQREDDATASI